MNEGEQTYDNGVRDQKLDNLASTLSEVKDTVNSIQSKLDEEYVEEDKCSARRKVVHAEAGGAWGAIGALFYAIFG